MVKKIIFTMITFLFLTVAAQAYELLILNTNLHYGDLNVYVYYVTEEETIFNEKDWDKLLYVEKGLMKKVKIHGKFNKLIIVMDNTYNKNKKILFVEVEKGVKRMLVTPDFSKPLN
ncbi:MAG: hypothetical protein PVG65_00835 [Candidatus Thorarchaeota archaeon]|jgi:hypothetical protein